MKPITICLALAATALPGFAQSPAPAPPTPPAAPRAGRSITMRRPVPRGWLGVGLGELTPERVKALKLKDDQGVEITRVDDNSPAAKAGLKENDVVLEVNGQKVPNSEEFARLVGDAAPGSKVSMSVWRNGSTQNIGATLGSRPASFFAYSTSPDGIKMLTPPVFPDGSTWVQPFETMMGQTPRIGIEGESLSGQLAEFFGVREGVLVRSVTANSAAAKAGLKAGDVIVKVGGTPVANTREVTGVLGAMHKTAAFTVIRSHKEITLNVEIAERREWPVPEREVL